MSFVTDAYGTPRAQATASSHGLLRPCPDCGEEFGSMWGRMGSGEPLRCAECFDNRVFGDDAEARAKAEAHHVEVMHWLLEAELRRSGGGKG